MNKIKAFIERWNHRLRGHLLVTYRQDDGMHVSLYAVNAYMDFLYSDKNFESVMDYRLHVDSCTGDVIYLPYDIDITITGA